MLVISSIASHLLGILFHSLFTIRAWSIDNTVLSIVWKDEAGHSETRKRMACTRCVCCQLHSAMEDPEEVVGSSIRVLPDLSRNPRAGQESRRHDKRPQIHRLKASNGPASTFSPGMCTVQYSSLRFSACRAESAGNVVCTNCSRFYVRIISPGSPPNKYAVQRCSFYTV